MFLSPSLVVMAHNEKKKPWASLLRCRVARNNEDEGGGPQGFVLVPLRFLRMLPCIALACTVFSLSCC